MAAVNFGQLKVSIFQKYFIMKIVSSLSLGVLSRDLGSMTYLFWECLRGEGNVNPFYLTSYTWQSSLPKRQPSQIT